MPDVRLLGEQRVAAGPATGGRSPSSRSTGLLAYLVLHAGTPQTRQHWAGVFWPDSTEAQARTNLRRELHHLRLLLSGHASLVVEPAALTWCDTPSCRVDVRVFRTERSSASAALAAGDRTEFVRHASAAIVEYRGDLLPGSYDEWVLDQRELLRRECADLCDQAAAARRELGDRTRAIEIARRRIQLEPLEEVGYRRLMELQAESGDRAAALSTYHRCATVLEQELGISADPATLRVVERLLARRGGAASDGVPAGWSVRSGVDRAGLVGRRGEVALLVRRLEEAVGGRSGLVVVSGSAGAGRPGWSRSSRMSRAAAGGSSPRPAASGCRVGWRWRRWRSGCAAVTCSRGWRRWSRCGGSRSSGWCPVRALAPPGPATGRARRRRTACRRGRRTALTRWWMLGSGTGSSRGWLGRCCPSVARRCSCSTTCTGAIRRRWPGWPSCSGSPWARPCWSPSPSEPTSRSTTERSLCCCGNGDRPGTLPTLR